MFPNYVNIVYYILTYPRKNVNIIYHLIFFRDMKALLQNFSKNFFEIGHLFAFLFVIYNREIKFGYGTVESCLSNYTDMACGTYAGGIVGRSMKNSKITDCFNLTKIWLNDNMYPGLIAGYAAKKSEITNTYSREYNNSMTMDIVGKTAGKFKVTFIPLDKLGNEESLEGLSDKWCIDNELPMLVSIKDYAALEKTYTIKGGRLTA